MSRPVQRLTVPTQKFNSRTPGLDAFMAQRRPMASCGNCGHCNQCTLPSINCSNAAGDVQNANVQVSVGSTANCVPNVNQPVQVNSLGVCVQPVNFNQAVPTLSVIDSCAGEQTDTVLLPNGPIYNTNISNNQPLVGIPGVFCNTCGQTSTNCACASGSKRWYRAGTGSVRLRSHAKSRHPQIDDESSKSSRSSKSSSSSSFVPAPRLKFKAATPRASNPRVVVEYVDKANNNKPAGCSHCGTGCTCPSPCTGNCLPTCTGTCCTCPNTCANCGGCQCIAPCATVNLNKIVPCNCNFLNLNIGQESQCDTCGSQTADIVDGCCPACAGKSKKASSKSHKASRSSKPVAKSKKPAKSANHKKIAGCTCPNTANCGGCACGNCDICPFGCVNSFATTTDACSNVTSTLQQIAPLPAGQVPCPPTNTAFCTPLNIPTFINTWYQSFWDYYTLWNCVNDIPLQFQETSYLPASTPNTGVYGVAISGSGYVLAVSYETGINQYAGIDIYYINYNTFNRIQTIVPQPTNPQCGVNTCCSAFNISMSFSNDGTVFAVGMPNLGASGCVFIFRLNKCGQYEMCAELQPGAMTGPTGTTGNPLFGYSVWVSGLGQRVVIGCPMCNGSCANGCNTISGSVVTCRPCVGGTWQVEQIITPQGNNSFIPFLINGFAANANPYQLFATNPSGLTQPSFGRSVATDTYSNNIVVGSNNVAFVFGNVNTNAANISGTNGGAGSLVGNTGPFELISTLSGTSNCNVSPNLYDQGIAVAISGDGLTVASSSISGTGVTYPIIPATVFVFKRNPYSYAVGNGAVSNAYTQVAALCSSSGYLRAGNPAAQAGLWISFDGSFIIAGDPNCSILGAAPDGCISAWMNTYCGWIPYYTITSPMPNCNFGTFIAVNLGLSQLFATGPNIPNPNGSTGTVMMYQ